MQKKSRRTLRGPCLAFDENWIRVLEWLGKNPEGKHSVNSGSLYTAATFYDEYFLAEGDLLLKI